MYRESNIVHNLLTVGMISILLGGFILSFVGCEQAPPPPPPPAKVEKTEPPPPTQKTVEEGEEEEPKPAYEYDPKGRREPFRSLLADLEPPEDPLLPPPVEEKTPLQEYELNEMKLTGIILGGLGDYARVRAPDGKTYTLNLGTLIGTHEGKVISISDNIVLIKETFRYESGKVEEVETPIYLVPIEEGEKP